MPIGGNVRQMEVIRTDCLVIGAGLAGAAYALNAAKAGLNVALVFKGGAYDANSDRAQGGIIYDSSGTSGLLAHDIMEASAGTANPAAIRQLVEEGPRAVEELLMGDHPVEFDRNEDGSLEFTREGGHSARRIIHARDMTGHAILKSVVRQVKETPGITLHAGATAVDLLTLSHNAEGAANRYAPLTCFGAWILLPGASEPVAFIAKKTILATGGVGQIYQHTTNARGTVGHGVAMAYRVGARVIDMEFVQFHPTVFYGKNAPRFLITEAIRGEGAVLINAAGRHFMEGVHPRASLAPRDIVSRAIHRELTESGEPCVYLDLDAMDRDQLKERFPTVYNSCLKHGVDVSKEPIPVVPAAHYSCGGVHADLNGRTNIRNLNAIGESGCTGLHGANRLASTSLLECLTSGKFAAKKDVQDIASKAFELPEPRPWKSPEYEADPTLIAQDLNLVQQTMWNYAGIVRTPRRLTRARRILLEAREEIQSFYRGCQVTSELVELRNAVQTALLVVRAATLNQRSRGAHFVVNE
ncbi:MAG: L-aspartate oxidase [Xanthomonadales bacterium]|jgi:L-aspartate oxidase|nr:L-aspartate oxidase [Xanthomonadales bacterium]